MLFLINYNFNLYLYAAPSYESPMNSVSKKDNQDCSNMWQRFSFHFKRLFFYFLRHTISIFED